MSALKLTDMVVCPTCDGEGSGDGYGVSGAGGQCRECRGSGEVTRGRARKVLMTLDIKSNTAKSPHQQEVERLRSELADVLRAIAPLVGKLPPDHAHRMAELRLRVGHVYAQLGPAGSPYEHEMDDE